MDNSLQKLNLRTDGAFRYQFCKCCLYDDVPYLV